MERTEIASKSLRSVGYDAETQALEVEFHSGRIYRYVGVPQTTYAWLMRSPGKGGVFNRLVRERHTFEDVTPNPNAERNLVDDLQRSLKR
jgi:hypothetical protein